jgi:uncharacterized protein (DUF1778 family)
MSDTARTERIDLRTNSRNKALIQRAAEFRNTTVSAYLIDSAIQRAWEDIQSMETLLLGETDRDLFFSALTAPPKPNRALCGLFNTKRR